MSGPRRSVPSPPIEAVRLERCSCLVLGLGNPLMGDDGVGWHLVEALRRDARLPPETDVEWGGTDLLVCAGLLAGRRRVILVDAVEGATPGATTRLDPWSDELDDRAGSAHALSLPGALRLLATVDSTFAAVDLRLLGVEVDRVEPGLGLSPALEIRLPELVDRLLVELAGSPLS